MQIEEITKIGVAAATIIGTAIAAILRAKKFTDTLDIEEVDTTKLTTELKELQIILHDLKLEVHGKHSTQLENIEEDITRLFDKTDKLTDILIDYFQKQAHN